MHSQENAGNVFARLGLHTTDHASVLLPPAGVLPLPPVLFPPPPSSAQPCLPTTLHVHGTERKLSGSPSSLASSPSSQTSSSQRPPDPASSSSRRSDPDAEPAPCARSVVFFLFFSLCVFARARVLMQRLWKSGAGASQSRDSDGAPSRSRYSDASQPGGTDLVEHGAGALFESRAWLSILLESDVAVLPDARSSVQWCRRRLGRHAVICVRTGKRNSVFFRACVASAIFFVFFVFYEI